MSETLARIVSPKAEKSLFKVSTHVRYVSTTSVSPQHILCIWKYHNLIIC